MKKNVAIGVIAGGLLGGVLVSNAIASRTGDAPRVNTAAHLASEAAPIPQQTAAITLTVASEGNEARYRIREQLAGFDLPNDAVGVTRDVKGSIALDRSGKVIEDQSRIIVGVASLTSDKDRRDNYVRRRTLETDKFPTVELAVTGIRGVSMPIPASGTRALSIDGNLTVHGVTRPTTWTGNATFAGNSITGTASTKFTFAEFGLGVPRVASVLSVADTIRLEYDFKVLRQ